MQKDKKVRAGKLRFVLQESIGGASTSDQVPEALAQEVLRQGGAQ